MKKHFFVTALTVVSLALNAQVVFNETFDANDHGWQEFKDGNASCFIVDGTLFIETDKDGLAFSTCYASYNPQQDFEMNVDVLTKKNDIIFGIVFDYQDDDNYRVILVDNQMTRYIKYRDGKRVGYRRNGIKEIKKAKKEGVQLQLKQNSQKLFFYVNGILAQELRYVDMQYSGVGFIVGAGQKLSFDNFTIKQ